MFPRTPPLSNTQLMHFPETEKMGKSSQKPHGELTLAEWQVPIQTLYNFFFLTGQGSENIRKGSQVKIRIVHQLLLQAKQIQVGKKLVYY